MRSWRAGAIAGALAALTIVAWFAMPVAFDRYLKSLGPLDLMSARAGSTVVEDRDGRLLRAFTMANGRWRLPVTHTEADPRYLSMLIAYEDVRFRRHHGVDFEAVARAALQMATHGRIVSGASTLTMQVARLMEPRERSLSTKVRQMARAWQIEREISKDGVLGRYLTLAPFGGNLEGVRAASLAYFGKEPRRLTIAEAALLVALPQAPEARRPDRHPDAARAARAQVLRRALSRGIIDAREAEIANSEPIPRMRREFPHLAAHAAEEAVAADRAAKQIRLSLDARLQRKLEALAKEHAERLGPKLSVAIVALDNASGQIRARVGAADYDDATRDGAVDMSLKPRSPGSALKPFIYAMAFEQGLAHPDTILFDRPARYGAYAPKNFDLGYQGAITARRALQQSLNLPAIELLADLGPSQFLARLHGMGADIVLPRDTPIGLAIGLGGLGISLVDIARLYAGLARRGEAPALYERLDGAPALAPARRVTDAVAAYYVEDILRGSPPPPNALSGRIAFKTGTSYGFRDALAIGFDKLTTIAVWVGRPDNGPTPGLIGRETAAPILFDAFARLGRAIEHGPPPRGVLHVARSAELPPPLRHLRQDAPKSIAATQRAALRISFPPDGAEVDLSSGAERLSLKALGGQLPLTWFVNGSAITQGDFRRQSSWKPDGAGFARVTVIDAKGATDSAMVRIE
jgi:penicillin-binding protein 1C